MTNKSTLKEIHDRLSKNKMGTNIRTIYTYLLSTKITNGNGNIGERISRCVGCNMNVSYDSYITSSLMSRTFLTYWTEHPGRQKVAGDDG